MANYSFTVGDTVRLKSGGPLMTVSATPDGTEVQAVWFPIDSLFTLAGGKVQARYLPAPQSGTFVKDTLELITQPKVEG